MRIGINIDGVLRNLLNKLISTHTKYYLGDVDVNNIVDYDLEKYFDFSISGETATSSLSQFFYEDCSLEIFGYSNEIEEKVILKLNNFIRENLDKNEIILLTRECGRAIPATLFFLSKTGCMAKEIKFVSSYEEMWEHCDILITTFPKALEVKPKNKTSIKINRLYNKDAKADYSLDNSLDLFEEEYIEKIINTKTVKHKELN